MLDLNDIVVFARVIEAGSFTAAARLLGMPKTTVSRRIAALEREVGVRLLQRTTRSLNVTDAGRLYYEDSSGALRTNRSGSFEIGSAVERPCYGALVPSRLSIDISRHRPAPGEKDRHAVDHPP